MSRTAICKDTIKKNTIEEMTRLGIFKPEYDTIVDIYAELLEQYKRITAEFVKSKYKFEESTADGGKKKAPIVATLETLRKDILAYSDRLCLNPKSLDLGSVTVKKKSKLESFFSGSQ